MSHHKILSGCDLVAKGFTKIEATLPEVGLKDVAPNGSWLEQKQIQSALESRKHLIDVERIEKNGVLSIAVWKEDKMLAEVIQKVGGHWQFMGHNIGSQLYLYPEEALFLMEVNCLQLIHNEIKVSLQQAYSLLLRGNVTILQYKVYASLSRLGYRLFRHERNKQTDYEKKIKLPFSKLNSNNILKIELSNKIDDKENNVEINKSEVVKLDVGEMTADNIPESSASDNSNKRMSDHTNKHSKEDVSNDGDTLYYKKKVQKIKSTNVKPCQNETLHKNFDAFPSLLKKEIVTMKAPEAQYIPKNINLRLIVYNINVENIQKKVTSPISSDSNIYSVSDEANGSHIRRLSNYMGYRQFNSAVMPPSGLAFATQSMQFRLFNMWRPHQNFNCNFNVLFQRPYLPRRFGPNFFQQFNYPINTQFRLYFNNHNFPGNQFVNFNTSNQLRSETNVNRNRKRSDAQNNHLEEIKKLASRLKQLVVVGDFQHVQALKRLISTYNIRYKTTLKLTDSFDVINVQNIVDTIELEDDEPRNKRRRTDEDFERNLNLLKQLAAQLKDIENRSESTARHRRAFTKVLRSFNDRYNVEYFINNEYAVLHRQIVIASSSDSDRPIENVHSKSSPGKKLKNPFNILKRLSEIQEQISEAPICNKENKETFITKNGQYSKHIVDTFSKNWLPPHDDFGRAEVIKNSDVIYNLTNSKHEEFLYDFLTLQQTKFKNWFDLKLVFFNSLEKAVKEFQSISLNYKANNEPVNLDDCPDMDTVLLNLRIIKPANIRNTKTRLSIDFDVYNRNVQNFKKSMPPIPHFRIICLDESSMVPCGEDVVALNAQYEDNVSVVFAVVGLSSVSYVQMNATELPVYTSNNTKV